MEGHTFLSWNIPNLVTVGLMGLVLFVAFKFGVSAWQKNKGG